MGALAGLERTVCALDMLGYGQSGGLRVDHQRQPVAVLELMDAEGLQTVTVGGVSSACLSIGESELAGALQRGQALSKSDLMFRPLATWLPTSRV